MLILWYPDKRVSEYQIVVLKIELLIIQPNPDSLSGSINVAIEGRHLGRPPGVWKPKRLKPSKFPGGVDTDGYHGPASIWNDLLVSAEEP